MSSDLASLRDWIGRSESHPDTVTAAPVLALGATLDHEPAPAADGRRCGTGCTSCRRHRQSEIGPDGHPRRGGFLPPVPLPRRMWAGSQFEFRTTRCAWATASSAPRHRRRRTSRAAPARWCS
jgi:3-methylfumaryl-CoA hydratase